jgi:hypothetical protein
VKHLLKLALTMPPDDLDHTRGHKIPFEVMQLFQAKVHLIKDKFDSNFKEIVTKDKTNESEDEECIILEDN